MSAVVLRCPNCGTTRTAPGECDACHEAPVRYYCTNHRPGVWLDSPACGQCGSRFGETAAAPPRPAPTKPSVRPPPAPAPTATRGPARTIDRDPRRPIGRGAGDPVPRRHEPPVPPLSESFDALEELMRGAGSARRPRPPAPPEPYPVRNMPSVGGCLMRLFLLALLLFVFGIGSLLLFGTAVVRMLGF